MKFAELDWPSCVCCGAVRPQITLDLPEGNVCAACVIAEVARLRKENERLSKLVKRGKQIKRGKP